MIQRLSIAIATFGVIATTVSSFAIENTDVFSPYLMPSISRQLSEHDSWECGVDENPNESCCNAVPDYFRLFSRECLPYYPLLARTLGFTSVSTDSEYIPSTDDLNNYCSSFCSFSIQALSAEYRNRSPRQRVCPQVLDGIWRLDFICQREDPYDSPSNSNNDKYCLPTYLSLYDAFSRQKMIGKDYTSELNFVTSTCTNNQPCLRRLMDSSVLASAVFGSNIIDGDTTDTGLLVRYTFQRINSISRIINLLCVKDVRDNAYCMPKTHFLVRNEDSDSRVAIPVIVPAPTSADTDATAINRIGRILLSGSNYNDDDSMLQDTLQMLLNPSIRPGFACTFCGRNQISSLLDLAEVYGVRFPTGGNVLTIDRIRRLLNEGCGIHNDMTCLQLLSRASPASDHYSPIAGAALLGLKFCYNDIQTNFANGCSSSCYYALQKVSERFGCCFTSIIDLQVNSLRQTSTLPIVADDDTDNVNGIKSTKNILYTLTKECGFPLPSPCRSTLQHFIATNFRNVQTGWNNLNEVGNAYIKDLATYTGYPSSIFSVQSSEIKPAIASSEATVAFIIGILTESNNSCKDTATFLRASTADNRVTLGNVEALLVTNDVRQNKIDPNTAVSITDVSDIYAPDPRIPIDVTSGASSLYPSLVAYGTMMGIVIGTLIFMV